LAEGEKRWPCLVGTGARAKKNQQRGVGNLGKGNHVNFARREKKDWGTPYGLKEETEKR